MSRRWQRIRKHDHYYKQAKTQGYRSRAAFKLKQINDKFKVIRSGDVVLDLGAAPGGWSQVAVELVGSNPNSNVIGIDLEPIQSMEGAVFLTADITDDNVIELIKEETKNSKVSVIISDAAPNISGNYTLDQAKSVFLAERSLAISEQVLRSHGNFVVKVFEGEDFKQFFDQVKSKFRNARIYSPKASRAQSSEIYVVGKDFQD